MKILMNVLKDLMHVPPMLLVLTPREGTTAHVTLDTKEIDSLVKVKISIRII